jgi:adenosylhomocysteine nucleosidase
LVETGGGTPEGAADAARALIEQGAEALISFGLAGGLDPYLSAGALLVPQTVVSGPDRFAANTDLASRFGGVTPHRLLGAKTVVASIKDKQALFHETGAHAVDLESGSVAQVAARRGLPFAVVRAICDPAGRPLPPAASVALDAAGAIAPLRIALSIARQPLQIAGLMALARDATAARATLMRVIGRLAAES